MVQTSARRRLLGIAIAVVLGLGLFLLAGTVWEHSIDRDQAVERFRSAGPAAAEVVEGLPEPGVYAYRTTGGRSTGPPATRNSSGTAWKSTSHAGRTGPCSTSAPRGG